MVQTDRILGFRGPKTFGARAGKADPSQQKRAVLQTLKLDKTEVSIDGQLSTVEIDPNHGPRVHLRDGTFGRMDCMLKGPRWSERSYWDQKVLIYMAAKQNRATAEQLDAEESRRVAMQAEEEELNKLAMLSPQEQKEHRCKKEMARQAIQWFPISLEDVNNNHEKKAPGIIYGLEFPWTEDLLEEFGPVWLTRAFHAAGTMDKRTKVQAVTVDRNTKITGGNNAGKFLFSVKYLGPRGELHTELFAKVPFQMTPATKSDRYSSSVYKQPMDFFEINTYRMLEAFFPMKTPKFYYGDISNKTSNFILITERILYSEIKGRIEGDLKPNAVEGPYQKCKDFQMRGSARDYYSILVKRTAQIAAYHKVGKFGKDEILRQNFNFPRPNAPQAYGCNPFGSSGDVPNSMERKLDAAIKFMETAQVIFPKYVTSQEFQNKFKTTMMTWSAYNGEIEFWKHMNEDYVAFGHQNLNADNGFFWRDGAGKLDCGIIDWGGFGSSNVPHKLWWMLNCADFELIQKCLPEFIDNLIATYQECGGPKLDKKTVEAMVWVTCLANINFMVAAVPNCYTMCSAEQWKTIKDRHDPRIADDVNGKSTLRTTLHVLNNGVRAIEELKVDQQLKDWIENVYVRQFQQAPKSDVMIFGK